MGRPFLLALTPRAGIHNHRFLASTGSGLTESSAANLTSAVLATEKPLAQGSTWLAVCKRGVLQAAGGRLGDEVLLLGDVNTEELTETDCQEVFTILGKLLDQLPPLLGRIDWESSGMVVDRSELAEWLHRDFAVFFPSSRSSRSSSWKLVAKVFCAVFLVAVGIGVYLFVQQQSQKGPKGNGPETRETNTFRTVQLVYFFDKVKVPKDKREDAERELNALLGDNNKGKSGFLKDVAVNNGQFNPYYFVLDEQTTFSELFGSYEGWNLEQVNKASAKLAAVSKSLQVLRKRMKPKEPNSPYLNLGYVFATTQALTMPESSPQHSRLLPFFNKKDLQIVVALRQLAELQTTEKTIKILDNSNRFEQSPAGLVRHLNQYKKEIRDSLGEEFDYLHEAVKEPLKNLKNDLEDLFAKIRELKVPAP